MDYECTEQCWAFRHNNGCSCEQEAWEKMQDMELEAGIERLMEERHGNRV